MSHPIECGQEFCAWCGDPTWPMGILGSLTHFRCRRCGTEFATTTTEDHIEILKEN